MISPIIRIERLSNNLLRKEKEGKSKKKSFKHPEINKAIDTNRGSFIDISC